MPECPVCKAMVDYTPMTRNADDGKPHSCLEYERATGERKSSRAPAVKETTKQEETTKDE